MLYSTILAVCLSNSFETTPFLETARLIFRTWSEDDLELALGLWGDPRVTHYIDARAEWSMKDVQARLAQEIVSAEKWGVQYWPIFVRTTGEHAGCCGLRPKEPGKGVLEIGFHICSRHWGKGFATEAANRVMDHAFGALQANALFAGHHPDNRVSRHILQKLGFRHTHREFYAPTGRRHLSYLLTADEYRRLQPAAD